MAGSSTADLRLRPTRDDDVGYVVAAEADRDNEHRTVELCRLWSDGRFASLVVLSLLKPEWNR